MNNYEYLNDKQFLNEIDHLKFRTQYIKIILLNWKEKPIQEIQGKATGGTLNLNGSSSLRRTCNLNVLIEESEAEITNIKNILSINKKIRLEIGIKNLTQQYTEEDKIWFPLGTYVITSCSISYSSGTNVTAALQLKDKMCLLNGECGGTLPASVTFNEYDVLNEDGEYDIEQPILHTIIQYAVNKLGKEQLGKIIISDIDNRIKKVMKWNGTSPLYIMFYYKDGMTQYEATMNETTAQERLAAGTISGYNTYESGEDIGYIYTDFVYTDELIGDAGSTVCDVLDKIKNYLGNYEYFYDIDGNFIFREIKNYLNTSKSFSDLEEMEQNDYLIDISFDKSVYTFDDSSLISSYSNSPQYNMIKNDFIVWGIREDSSGLQLPIRYHLAIDSKPKVGNTYSVFFYEDPDDNLTKAKNPVNYTSKDTFPATGSAETFYLALDTQIIYKWDSQEKVYVELPYKITNVTTTDWRTELYLQGAVAEGLSLDSNDYYSELNNEWPKLYDVQAGEFLESAEKDPSGIDFFLDFIDSTAAISELSIDNIGRRTKVITDDSINCIFEPEIPNLVLINLDDTEENIAAAREECESKGQDYIQVEGSIYSLLAGGGGFNSAYSKIRELLYEYTSYNESISLQTIPIYYLEPNSRITVSDTKSNIYGDYIISTISIPLDISSNMTISATRALERF